jgi:large subunit ribosomal protein L2
MGKTIIKQARGHAGPAYRVRKKAYIYKISYPKLSVIGNAKVMNIINSRAHSAPIAQIIISDFKFYVPAAQGLYFGKDLEIGKGKIESGNILPLNIIPQGTKVFNIEFSPGNGGKICRSSGSFAIVGTKDKGLVELIIKRRRLFLNENCRAIIGVASGEGRVIKPIVKAGKMHHMMKSIGRKWHRTSAIKTNIVDHPFGSGRGKRIKSKIAKRNAPSGANVGLLRPRRTGKTK